MALSRATTLEGLWLRGAVLRAAAVKAHPRVLAFYEAMPTTPPLKPALTAEQQARIQRNKELALERKRKSSNSAASSASAASLE